MQSSVTLLIKLSVWNSATWKDACYTASNPYLDWRSLYLDDFACCIALSAIEDVTSLWAVLYYNIFCLFSLPRFLFLLESHFSLQACCHGITCISGTPERLWPSILPAVSLFYLSLLPCTWWLWSFRWDCFKASILHWYEFT